VNKSTNEQIIVGSFSLDPWTGHLSSPAKRKDLPPKSTQVLLPLIQHAGQLVSRETIHEEVWTGEIVTDAQISKPINEL
jgi:DNA-binding winged helix-turn-helix (wHTH) protein